MEAMATGKEPISVSDPTSAASAHLFQYIGYLLGMGFAREREVGFVQSCHGAELY
jgi:hypothetical protein